MISFLYHTCKSCQFSSALPSYLEASLATPGFSCIHLTSFYITRTSTFHDIHIRTHRPRSLPSFLRHSVLRNPPNDRTRKAHHSKTLAIGICSTVAMPRTTIPSDRSRTQAPQAIPSTKASTASSSKLGSAKTLPYDR